MKKPKPRPEAVCSICSSAGGAMTNFMDGHVCESCSDQARQGRDRTTQALKLQQLADRTRADQRQGIASNQSPDVLEYSIASAQLMAQELVASKGVAIIGSGGEVMNPKPFCLANTLADPSTAAVDASNHRTDLLTMVGSDIAAMALDAADTIEAGNSLEKMLAHQMAAIHDASMRMVYRANLIQDPGMAAKTFNCAMKGFSAYQGAVGALRQLRGNQQQHIVVQHVNVSAGGQAMVGTVNTRGGQP